jgi:hypothetical protein
MHGGDQANVAHCTETGVLWCIMVAGSGHRSPTEAKSCYLETNKPTQCTYYFLLNAMKDIFAAEKWVPSFISDYDIVTCIQFLHPSSLRVISTASAIPLLPHKI